LSREQKEKLKGKTKELHAMPCMHACCQIWGLVLVQEHTLKQTKQTKIKTKVPSLEEIFNFE
jgi:hypothetical protein